MKNRRKQRIGALVLCVLLLVTLLAGCGGQSLESQLIGSWYPNGKETGQRDGGMGPAFTLYSDGTCKIAGEYGSGTWAIVNENELKLTNYYGETEIAKISSLEDGCLTLENGAVFWNRIIDNNAG